MRESINAMIARLERTAAKRAAKGGAGFCTCPAGEQRFFFTVAGMTPQEVAAVIPGNRRYCPRCGGRNIETELIPEELGL